MKISLRALLLATLATNAVALPSPLDITVPAVFTSSCNRDPGAICGFLVTSCVIASKDAVRTRVRLGALCGGAAVWCLGFTARNEILCRGDGQNEGPRGDKK
ncbi:hypothetical protein F5887DRAFT_970386, partial [Amanita rubescens]